MRRTTAPSGYRTNTEAIYHLIRLGPSIWKPPVFLVLLFHVERSASYGKESDQHSQAQAMEGIYSYTAERRTGGQGRWIRGSVGISLAQWKRANNFLVKAKLITKIRRKGKNDADAATEYIPIWLTIRAALEEYEYADAPHPQPLLSQPVLGPPVAHPEPPPRLTQSHPLAHSEPPPGSPGATPWLTQSHTLLDLTLLDSTVLESTLIDCARAEPTATTPPNQSKPSLEEEAQQDSAAEVQLVIETAFGRPLWPNDPIPGQLLAIAHRMGIPTRPLCLFLREKADEMRANCYPLTSPKVFVTATANGLQSWAKSNRDLVASAQMQEERNHARREYRAAELTQMQPPAPTVLCPECQGETTDGTCTNYECVTKRFNTNPGFGRVASGS
jgi:hypothetical protein